MLFDHIQPNGVFWSTKVVLFFEMYKFQPEFLRMSEKSSNFAA